MSLYDYNKCAENGWDVGTFLLGDEGYGPAVIEIVYLTKVTLLCRIHVRNGWNVTGLEESTWTLSCRDWFEIPALRKTGEDAVPLPRFAYHWSPSRYRTSIQEHGLRPTPGGITDGKTTVCLSPSPPEAWKLSGALREETEWDLWKVRVPAHAFWRSDGEAELRTFFAIPADDVKLIHGKG